MNISSQIVPTYGSNSSYHFISNGIHLGIGQLAMNIINVLCGIPVNSYVIWLIVTGTGNGLVAEFFSLNLSVCEICLCLRVLLHLVFYKCNILLGILNFLDGLTITVRPLFQSLICVERYLAVVHPVTFLKYKPLRYRVICSVIIWVTGSIFSGVSFMTSLFVLSLPFNLLYILLLSQFLLFLSIQLFFLVAVLRALKQSGPGERRREREENHMKRRAFYFNLITTVSMVVIYAPYMIFLILASLGQIVEALLYVCYVCLLLGGLVQPLLFLHRVGKLPFIHSQ